MAKFEYLSSFDELTWRVNFQQAWVALCDIPWDARQEVREWAVECCTNTVWLWNGVSTPDVGDCNWGKIAHPQHSKCYLIFEHAHDCELFMLKYADRFSAEPYGTNLVKAWRDSRNN